MFRSLQHTFRLLHIGSVLARYDCLFFLKGTRLWLLAGFLTFFMRERPLRGTRGERLSLALQTLGPSFIKLGQALSTRSDLIGDGMAHDLAELRDRLPPFPTKIAKRTIELSFGKPVEELFASFEDQPIAAASIAQVHFATTHDGREVAVKILRPRIAEAFARDIAFFRWLARLAERLVPDCKRMRLPEMVATLAASVALELDLRYEAAAAAELKENTRDDPGIYVPAVDWNLTAEHVLTMERVTGIPIDDVKKLKSEGRDLDVIVGHAARSFFLQVFRDGFFHADLHPGNLFILPDNRIAVVDFGIMGRLDLKNRIFLAEVLRGFFTKNFHRVAEVHFDAGIVPPHQSVDHFAQACRAIAMPILDKPLNEISIATLLAQLFKVSKTFEMQLQPQFLLLQKTMMLAEGVGRMLAPEVNMWKTAEPLITDWASEHLSRKAMVKQVVKETILRLKRLPEVLDKIDKALNNA